MPLRSIVFLLGTLSVVACGPVFRSPSTAAASDGSSDGVLVPLPLAPATARNAVAQAFRANGFTVASASSETVRSDARSVTADMILVLVATIVPVDLPTARSYVTMSGTFTLSASGDPTQVTRAADGVRGPWRYLTAVADSLRQIARRAP